MFLSKFLSRYRRWRFRRELYYTKRCAESLFQVRECDGGLWITYGGGLVCPCTMFRDAACDVLSDLREIYVAHRFMSKASIEQKREFLREAKVLLDDVKEAYKDYGEEDFECK